jgi:hypothetical protein
MTLPVRGGLGFFLTEVLSNAMRHGVAGSGATASSASWWWSSRTTGATIACAPAASMAVSPC